MKKANIKVRSVAALASSAVILGSLQIKADVNGVLVGGGSVKGLGVLADAGQYDVQTYDRNVLERITPNIVKERQDEARKFVEDTTRSIEIELSGLVDDLYSAGGIVEIYRDVSARGQMIDVARYLGATQPIRARVNQIETKLKLLLSIPGALGKTNEGVEIRGEKVTNLPAPLKLALEDIQDIYRTQLAKILGDLDALTFTVTHPTGDVRTVNGVSYIPEGSMITPEAIAELRKEALSLKTIRESDRQKLKELNLTSLATVNSIIRAFGKSQKYRFQVNGEGKVSALNDLAEFFWARDYLRAIYGVQLGAIAVDYRKRQVNWDFFSSSNNLKFLGEFITDQPSLIEYQDKIANALKTAEARSGEVSIERTKGVIEDIKNLDVERLLEFVMSGYTFVRGESQLAAINTAVLILLERDIRHELMLTKAGGLKAMRDEYRATYYKTAEMEAATKARAENYMGSSSSAENYENDESDYGTINDTATLNGSFQIAVAGLDSVLDRIEKARKIESGIEEMEKLMGTHRKKNNLRDTL